MNLFNFIHLILSLILEFLCSANLNRFIKSKLRAIIVLAMLWAIVVVAVNPVVNNNQGSNSSFSKDRIEISIC
jgi:hypothetical protein